MLNQKRKPPMGRTIATPRVFSVLGITGVVNMMEVRYIKTVDNTKAYKVPSLPF